MQLLHLQTKCLSDMFHACDSGRGAVIAPLPDEGYLLLRFCETASSISCVGTSSSLWIQPVVAIIR